MSQTAGSRWRPACATAWRSSRSPTAGRRSPRNSSRRSSSRSGGCPTGPDRRKAPGWACPSSGRSRWPTAAEPPPAPAPPAASRCRSCCPQPPGEPAGQGERPGGTGTPTGGPGGFGGTGSPPKWGRGGLGRRLPPKGGVTGGLPPGLALLRFDVVGDGAQDGGDLLRVAGVGMLAAAVGGRHVVEQLDQVLDEDDHLVRLLAGLLNGRDGGRRLQDPHLERLGSPASLGDPELDPLPLLQQGRPRRQRR